MITEGTKTKFETGDRIYFTVTKEPAKGKRPVVFLFHGNLKPRLAGDPAFFRGDPLEMNLQIREADGANDPNLVVLKTDGKPDLAVYTFNFIGKGEWRVDKNNQAVGGPVMTFNKEYTTPDGHLTAIVKEFAAPQGLRSTDRPYSSRPVDFVKGWHIESFPVTFARRAQGIGNDN